MWWYLRVVPTGTEIQGLRHDRVCWMNEYHRSQLIKLCPDGLKGRISEVSLAYYLGWLARVFIILTTARTHCGCHGKPVRRNRGRGRLKNEGNSFLNMRQWKYGEATYGRSVNLCFILYFIRFKHYRSGEGWKQRNQAALVTISGKASRILQQYSHYASLIW